MVARATVHLVTTDTQTLREQCKELQAKQLAMAKEWQNNRYPITIKYSDEWPIEWHHAGRMRCIHGHVAIGTTRLAGCRVCARENGEQCVPAVLTSPGDESDPTEEKTPGCTINATLRLKIGSVEAAVADLGQRLHTLGHSTWPTGLAEAVESWLRDQLEVTTKVTPRG